MKRPIVLITVFLCFGIFANFYLANTSALTVFTMGLFLLTIHLCIVNKEKFLILLILPFLLGMLLTSSNNQLFINTPVTVIGEVKDIDINGKYSNLLVTTHSIDSKDYNTNILVITNSQNVNIADEVTFTSKLIPFDKDENRTEFIYNKSKSIDYKTFAFDLTIIDTNKDFIYYTNKLRLRLNKVYDTILPLEEANIVKALVLGDKDSISTEIKSL